MWLGQKIFWDWRNKDYLSENKLVKYILSTWTKNFHWQLFPFWDGTEEDFQAHWKCLAQRQSPEQGWVQYLESWTLAGRSRMGTQAPWKHRKRVPQTQLTFLVFLGHQSVMSWLTVLNCFFLNRLFFLKKKKKKKTLRIYMKHVDVTLITLLCLRKKEGLQSQNCSALGSTWAWSSSMCWPCSLPWNLCLRPSLLSGTRPMTDVCP